MLNKPIDLDGLSAFKNRLDSQINLKNESYAYDRLKQYQCENYYDGPILSIIDDDGYHHFIDGGIADMYRSKGVFPSLAIVACRAETPVGTTTSGDPYVALSWSDLKDLAKDGFEIVSHSYSHDKYVFPSGTNASEAAFKKEYEWSQELFLKNGFSPRTIVYPWGNPDLVGSELARKYYDYGVLYRSSDSGLVDFVDLNYSRIPRNTTTSFNVIKARIDEAVANNGWLVWGTHSYDNIYREGPQPTLEVLTQVIDYALSVGMRIEPFERAARLRQPALDCGKTDASRITIYQDGSFNNRFVSKLITQAYDLDLIAAPEELKTLVGLSVKYAGGAQQVNLAVDTYALTVKGIYSDGTTEEILEGYTITPPIVQPGTNSYIVEYTDAAGITVSGSFYLSGDTTLVEPTGFTLGEPVEIARAVGLEDERVIEICMEGTVQIPIIYTPENANTGLSITWTSSSPNVTLVQDGVNLIASTTDTMGVTFTITGVLDINPEVIRTFSAVTTPHFVTSVNTGTGRCTTAAYFETDYIPNQNTKVVAEAIQEGNSLSGAGGALFGARQAVNTNAFYIYNNITANNDNFACMGNQKISGAVNSSLQQTITLDATGCTYNNTVVGTFTNMEEFSCPVTMGIFNVNDNGSYTSGRVPMNTRLFSLKIYENDVLVRDFRPCLYQGKIALYDIVRGVFSPLLNAPATGYFTYTT